MPPICKDQFGIYYLYVTEEFDAACKKAGDEFRRFQDVYGRMRELIADDPTQGGSFKERDICVFVTDSDPAYNLPGMRISYIFGKQPNGENRLVLVDLDVFK
jgi:hypothetical protein